ncbi:MAG: UDP-glucose 4-epimerase GalE [Polyangiales bacterium]
MRVMVTGGAGYVGGVLVDALLDAGHSVVVLEHREAHPRDPSSTAEVARCDIRDRERLATILRERRVEAVCHAAARSLVAESVADPSGYWDVNVRGTLSLLDAMRAADVGALVLSSSAAVYDPSAPQPMAETSPLRPANPYGDTKVAAERAVDHYRAAYGLRAAALRYFNVAGATATRGERHDPETHIVPRALMALTGELDALTVNGTDWATPDGTCVRDYVHVNDVARANLAALDAVTRSAELPLAYNVASAARGFSVREVLDAVTRVTGRSPPVRYGPRREGDPPLLVADCARAKETLGWAPRESDLDAMVESAWRWWTTARGT